MPNTATGISTPEAGEDVNTQSGFEAALASKGVEPEAGDNPADDTSVASGLEVIEPGQPRTPSGQFAPKETVPAEEPETPTATADPLVAEYLAKYDGDMEAAVKAAAHQQRLIGEQGSKLGEQAERLARLEGMVEGLGRTTPKPSAPTLTADQVEENSIALIESRGYAQAATDAANLSLETGDDRLYGAIIDAWSLESGYQAAKHVADFTAWNRSQDAPAAGTDPWVAQQKTVDGMSTTLKSVASERADWGHIAPHMLTALEQLPEAVAALVSSDDPAARMAGANIVADRATVLAGPARAEDAGIPSSVQRKLAGSAVATGALRPAANVPGGQPQTKEEAISDFKAAIMNTETTSVASGLTFGK